MFNLYTVQPFSTYIYDKVYVKQFEDYRISELDVNTVTPTGYCPGCELTMITGTGMTDTLEMLVGLELI